jgi:putative endonuclease
MDKPSYVYMLASQRYGTLYLGVTADLVRPVYEHREAFVAGFTKEYEVKRLVWYEIHTDIVAAITREKQLKKWNRAWKIELVQQRNPHWRDLFDEIVA